MDLGCCVLRVFVLTRHVKNHLPPKTARKRHAKVARTGTETSVHTASHSALSPHQPEALLSSCASDDLRRLFIVHRPVAQFGSIIAAHRLHSASRQHDGTGSSRPHDGTAVTTDGHASESASTVRARGPEIDHATASLCLPSAIYSLSLATPVSTFVLFQHGTLP